MKYLDYVNLHDMFNNFSAEFTDKTFTQTLVYFIVELFI